MAHPEPRLDAENVAPWQGLIFQARILLLRGLLLLAIVSLVVAPTTLNCVRAATDGQAAPASIVYDIPAQALESALEAYIEASGAQVFFETAVMAGRRSTQVKGPLAPDVALKTLLLGTGLILRRTDVDAFIVTAAPTSPAGTSAAAIARDSRFIVALQAAVLRALCSNSQTRPGNYKLAFELWVSPSGVINRTELIGSTGDDARDATLGNALLGLAIDALPPEKTPQPLVLAIRPGSSPAAGDCAGQ